MQEVKNANFFELLFIFILATFFLLGCGGGGGSTKTSPTIPKAVSLTSLKLNLLDSTLKVSEKVQINVSGTYSDGSTKDLTSLVTWSASNSIVVDVSSTGMVTALSVGSSTVTASYEGLSYESSISVIDLVDLSISPSTVTLPMQSSKQLSVIGIYTDNSSESVDHLVTWKTSNSDVAGISNTGEIFAIAAGVVTVSATLGSKSTNLVVTVSPASLQSIFLNSSTTQIPIGLTATYTAMGVYSDGSEQDLSNQVVWSVSNSSIASINSKTGLLTALKTGNVSVIASKEGKTSALEVTVSPATLTGIAITPTEISLAKGLKKAVNVTANFSDNTTVDVSEQVTWDNSNKQVAIIETNPLTIVSLKEGSTTLTANLFEQQAELIINVTNAELLALEVYPVNASIPLGHTQQFYAHGIFSDNTIQDLTSEITWFSSNENQALISNAKFSAGLAETKAVGVATVTAVIGQIRQETTLTIANAQLSHIEIVPTTIALPKNSEAKIKALGHFSNGSLIDLTKKVMWFTSNARILDVVSAKKGSILSANSGSALLNAELDGVTGLANVSITDSTLQSIVISAPQSTLPMGINQRLTATGIYSDMSTRDISHEVTWLSEDVHIATVSNNAKAGLLKAVSPGQLTITASLGEVSDEFTINVTDAELTNIKVSTPKAKLNVQSSTLATAVASFSDGSSIDVSSQVYWSSSDVNVASISNIEVNKGKITGHSAGKMNLSASLMGVRSPNVLMDVEFKPHLPKAINISVQPNIILNDNNDAAEVKLVLIPSEEHGMIADGTPVTLTITEGETIRNIALITTNGEANYILESEYNGFVSLSATQSDYTVNAGVISTDNFNNAVLATGRANVVYENNTLKTGSSFHVFLRNLTNRRFDINQINIGYLDPSNNNTFIHFPDSPFTSDEYTNNGNFDAADFTFIGYELLDDVVASTFVITYEFYEEKSDTPFRFKGVFNFAQ